MINILIIILSVILDQVTKWLAVTKLKPIDTYPIIEDVFHLTYRTNTGAAFSMLKDKTNFLAVMSIIIIVVLALYLITLMRQGKVNLLQVSIAMILGGAVGNMIDRVRLGYVIDFFDFRLIDFAVFNVADSFMVVGTILFGIAIFFFYES